MSSLRLTPIYPQNIHQYPILFINPYHIPISHPSCQPMTPTPRHSRPRLPTAPPHRRRSAPTLPVTAAALRAAAPAAAAARHGAWAPGRRGKARPRPCSGSVWFKNGKR